MSRESGPAWVTFWDKANKRVLVMAADYASRGERDGLAFVAHDSAGSKPGVYDVWRDLGEGSTEPPPGSVMTGDIVCVECHYEDRVDDIAFPEHLLSRDLLSYPTVWGEQLPSFMQWFGPGWETPNHDELAREVREFEGAVSQFPGFSDWVFTVGELVDDPNWEWGERQGVYCFISAWDGKVVYVGRALVSLGSRIADQLRSQSDPVWKEIVTNRDTRVRVFAVEDGSAYMASALEAFLIDRLKPRINSRRQ